MTKPRYRLVRADQLCQGDWVLIAKQKVFVEAQATASFRGMVKFRLWPSKRDGFLPRRSPVWKRV